jgi:hypothetical protein
MIISAEYIYIVCKKIYAVIPFVSIQDKEVHSNLVGISYSHELKLPTCSSQSRKTRAVDISINPLTEVTRSRLVTGDSRVLLPKDVCALEQLVLDIGIIVWQTQAGIHTSDVHVIKGDVGARALIRTVNGRSDVKS